jgi:hypothetical protein
MNIGFAGGVLTMPTIGAIKHTESMFVFIETLNTQVGCFAPPIYTVGTKAVEMAEPPGQNHALGGANGTTLGFADGHAIFWQYANPTTYPDWYSSPRPSMSDYIVNSRSTADALQLAAWSGGPCPPGATP